MKKVKLVIKNKDTKVMQIPKKDISVGADGILTANCSKDMAKELKNVYGLDVNDQTFLRHLYFATIDGKFSVTVPNNMLVS